MEFSAPNFEMALSYDTYSEYAEKLLTNISLDSKNIMQQHAKVNLNILRRLKQSVQLTVELKHALEKASPSIFLILTEGYCGDSAQTFPVFGRMQEMYPDKIEIRVVLRDAYLDIADIYFRTRAIPTLICLDRQTFKERFVWGNRPKPAQQIMDNLKAVGATPKEKSVALHRWYAKDKTLTLQKELMELLSERCRNQSDLVIF